MKGTFMRNRFVAAGLAAALVLSACGSRVDKDELGKDDGVDAPSTGGSGATTTVPEGDGGPMFGTMDAPCGPAPEGAGEVTPSTGVTQDTIKIGVISDKAAIVKVPTASIEESVKAFVGYCNELGGINGRKLELKTYDAQLAASDAAATSACNDGLLALVGTGVVLDDKMAQVLVDCNLPNVAAYTATPKAAMADLTITPLPNPTTHFNTSPGRWIAEQFPEAVKKAGIIASDLPVATVQSDRIVQAYEEAAGFNYVYQKPASFPQVSYAGFVAEMRNAGVQHVSAVSDISETVKLLKDMKTAGFKPEVIDLGQQYYDPNLLSEPGAEGAYVQVNSFPFEDADEVPAVKQFLDIYGEVDTDIEPTSLGVQAFSAGLLFAVAAQAVGDDLNRETLFEQLKTIHEWDGGGLHFTTDPGNNRSNACFLYMQIQDGEFVRVMPQEAGRFECVEDDAIIDLGNDWGGGAKKGGS